MLWGEAGPVDVCEYVIETHRRFPAHTDAIHVPGVWLQAHHVEDEYYDRYRIHSQCIGLESGGEANLMVATRSVAVFFRRGGTLLRER